MIRNADLDDNGALEIHEFVRTVVDDATVGEEAMKEQAEDAVLLAKMEAKKIDDLVEALKVPYNIRMAREMEQVRAYLLDQKPVVEYFLKEDPKVRWQLCRYATVKHYKAGDFLFQQEDPTTELFVILRGQVQVSVEKGLEDWETREDIRVSAWAGLGHMLVKYITGFEAAKESCSQYHDEDPDDEACSPPCSWP